VTKVLVTGATGFLGRQCLPPLVEAGHEVHAVSRSGVDVPGVASHRADLLDRSDRLRVVEDVGATHLLHLAWCTDHGRFWSDPRNVDWAGATLDLVRAFALGGGARAVVAGSCAEYDWTGADADPLHETRSPRRPATLYGQAKLSTQEILSAYAPEVGLSFGWGVLFFLLGPSEKPDRLVPSVITALLAGRPAALTAGTQVRDFLDIRDAGRAMVELLTSDVEGRVNVASGRGVPLAEVCTRVAYLLGRPDLLDLGRIPMSAADPSHLVADVGRLTTEVGFVPHHDLDTAIASAVGWWRAAEDRTDGVADEEETTTCP